VKEYYLLIHIHLSLTQSQGLPQQTSDQSLITGYSYVIVFLVLCLRVAVSTDVCGRISIKPATTTNWRKGQSLSLAWCNIPNLLHQSLNITPRKPSCRCTLKNPLNAKACQKLLQFDVLTTLSLTILAYLHWFSCCCVRNLRNPKKFSENSNL